MLTNRVNGREIAAVSAGQAAVEVLSYASFFLLVFVVSMALFLQMQSQEMARAESAYAQEVAYSIADQMHTVFIGGQGYRQSAVFPKEILGRPYTIMVSRSPNPSLKETGFVYIDWEGASGKASFSAPTITTSYSALTFGDFITVQDDYIVIKPQHASGKKLMLENTVLPDGSPTIRISASP